MAIDNPYVNGLIDGYKISIKLIENESDKLKVQAKLKKLLDLYGVEDGGYSCED
jgi:hypothetical protein